MMMYNYDYDEETMVMMMARSNIIMKRRADWQGIHYVDDYSNHSDGYYDDY